MLLIPTRKKQLEKKQNDYNASKSDKKKLVLNEKLRKWSRKFKLCPQNQMVAKVVPYPQQCSVGR